MSSWFSKSVETGERLLVMNRETNKYTIKSQGKWQLSRIEHSTLVDNRTRTNTGNTLPNVCGKQWGVISWFSGALKMVPGRSVPALLSQTFCPAFLSRDKTSWPGTERHLSTKRSVPPFCPGTERHTVVFSYPYSNRHRLRDTGWLKGSGWQKAQLVQSTEKSLRSAKIRTSVHCS